MDGEAHAFSSQVLEIDRAFENLARSGKLYPTKAQANTNNYGAQVLPQSSRYNAVSHYASQRQPSMSSNRHYNGARAHSAAHMSAHDYSNQYYQPPPPLQQQYGHVQQPQHAYNSAANSSFGASMGVDQPLGDITTYSSPVAQRYSTQTLSNHSPQEPPRAYSPFGGSSTLPPLSRLNTGGAGSSSHSTTPSTTAAMSSSTSMLPPGYGRESFASVAPGHVHSRAHSITGTLSSLGTSHYSRDALSHSRAQSTGQPTESLRSTAMSHMNSSSSGIFSPTLGHSRAASISAGSNGTASPSAATFNFFSNPTSSATAIGSSSLQSSYSSGNHTSSTSRIAPIGRPSHARSIPEAVDEPRNSGRGTIGTAFSSVTTSSVTSPLSNGFTDGWLDEIAANTSPITSAKSASMSEAQRKSLQSVWNN